MTEVQDEQAGTRDEQGARETAGRPRRRKGLDTIKAAKVARRLVAPVGILCFLVLYLCFGLLRVPSGMDTVPEVPPGSLCLLDKRDGAVRQGVLVFVDLPDGGTLLSRVSKRTGDEIEVRNDNPASRLPDSDQLGALPLSSVRGVVLTAFEPDRSKSRESRRSGEGQGRGR